MNNLFKTILIYLFSYILLVASCNAWLDMEMPLLYYLVLGFISFGFSWSIVNIKE